MNKHTVLIGLTFILMTMTACGSVAQAAPKMPTAIQDPLLLEAWSRLDNHQEPVRLWDGTSLSGHDLAQFVLGHQISILWGSENICGGGSCSFRSCEGETCSYQDEKPGGRPIYLRPSIQSKGEGMMDDLVDSLAHEIYHYMLPNGQVRDTLYEEFSAYYIGASIAQKYWTNFKDYNPLQPACLVKWFDDTHLLEGYRRFKAYPKAMLPEVDTSSATCHPGGETVSQAARDGLLTCTLNVDGSVDCQFPPQPTPTPEYRLVCTTYPSGLRGCETIWLDKGSSGKVTVSIP